MEASPEKNLRSGSAGPAPKDEQTTRLLLRTPGGFDFWRTVYSHGWCSLPPFSSDASSKTLSRVVSLADGVETRCTLSNKGNTIAAIVRSSSPLSQRQRQEIIAQIRTCLRLDEDFSSFFREAKKHARYRWIERAGAGRLLRCPTVFEDLVKMICTTNCTWALTTTMVRNLVSVFGARCDDSTRAFPTPEAIARSNERILRTTIRAGYRAPYLLELARSVASGKVDIERWRSTEGDTDELYREILAVKGVGPYVAQNLMRLLGRYDYLALDSWVRGTYAKLHHRGRRVKDSTIERHYAPFGQWKGLFFWLEMTRDWHDSKFPPS